jgi:phage baseplate assembly protein W
MQNVTNSFLGTGWAFPPAFDNHFWGPLMVSDAEDIKQSILIILNTTPGERLMQPEFGCNLKSMVFEIMNDGFINDFQNMVMQSLLRFEPRINFTSAEIIKHEPEEGVLYISINYTIIITNTRHNIVYPFYLTEGTNI